MTRAKSKADLLDDERYTGQFLCEVCGMRNHTKAAAAACCYPLVPGVTAGKYSRRPTDPDEMPEMNDGRVF